MFKTFQLDMINLMMFKSQTSILLEILDQQGNPSFIFSSDFSSLGLSVVTFHLV